MISGSIQNNKLRILGKLTASLIHEIRNPLSAIRLNLDLIKMEDNLSDEVSESVNDCLSATDRIEYMVDSLLSFARVVTHGRENISLNKVTSNALNLLAVKATKYSVKIEQELDRNLLYVYADENKVLQVILNLITNAIESCEENNSGNILIKTFLVESGENKNVYWTIEDNGIGISEEDQKKIFEDFYTSKENGTGLGLSVCKMLANEQYAEIDFESKLGVGTKFQIVFDLNRMRKLYEAENSSNR
jgi:signal transduction histidine kinase